MKILLFGFLAYFALAMEDTAWNMANLRRTSPKEKNSKGSFKVARPTTEKIKKKPLQYSRKISTISNADEESYITQPKSNKMQKDTLDLQKQYQPKIPQSNQEQQNRAISYQMGSKQTNPKRRQECSKMMADTKIRSKSLQIAGIYLGKIICWEPHQIPEHKVVTADGQEINLGRPIIDRRKKKE